MKLNAKTASIYTHEGAKAQHINPTQQLRRAVMACLLWEDTFYESGVSIVERIKKLVPLVDPKEVVQIARDARGKMNLRHIPLLLVREMARHSTHKKYVSRTLQYVIQRPDELTEFLAIYWKDGKEPLSKKVKQGLAYAFQKFNEYQFAKYDRDNAIKLRDALFLSHSKPQDKAAEELYKKIVNRTLTTPDTWEVALSSGENKNKVFERLMQEKKLGALAFLRNLRNMREANIKKDLIKLYSETVDISKILPYQFIAAAKTNPQYEDIIEAMMLRNLELQIKLPGKTLLLVDVSGSMAYPLSSKSEMTRLDAACGLAILLREIAEDVEICSFSNSLATIPSRRGFALRDAIFNSQIHAGTELGSAMKIVNDLNKDGHRVIVITDEQSGDRVPSPIGIGYMINVASYENGVGYGAWNHIDGFSGAILDWIKNLEAMELGPVAQ